MLSLLNLLINGKQKYLSTTVVFARDMIQQKKIINFKKVNFYKQIKQGLESINLLEM